jgi:hypothetical protein
MLQDLGKYVIFMKVTFLYKEKQQNEGWMKSLFGFG